MKKKAVTNNYTDDYLLDRKIKIFQPIDGYRASTDAVMLAAMIKKADNAKILDVGSGTGAVSLCLAERFKMSNILIDGLEIQPRLVELSNKSAAENGFDFLKFHHCDISDKEQTKIFGYCSYDVVISNPPYSEHDMPSPNLGKATAHNMRNIDFSDWVNFCLKMAKPFGKIYMVNRVEILPKLCALIQNKAGGLTVLPIYSKPFQPAKRIIVSFQKDSKAPCNICRPFLMHTENGAHTNEAEKILRQGYSFFDL